MDRASQRFTLQARVITVVLSLALVFAAHLDAIRLFRMLSSDAQVRTQLTASADAIMKQAGQISRTHDDGTSREVVPDLYRKAMVEVLQSVPVSVDPAKLKSRHSSRQSASQVPTALQVITGGSPAESADGVQSSSQAPADGALVSPGILPTPVTTAKEPGHRSSKSSKAKPQATEIAKSAATPAEDRATIEAKARASNALVATPGFASREDAVYWLRRTLNSDTAVGNLVANYEHAVNAQLVSDADKLLDHAASLQHDLANSELQIVPEKWTGWKPVGNELPGLLVALALLTLGAPVCFNVLKTVASLRPLQPTNTSMRRDRRIRREDRRSPQTREQARPQTKAQAKAPEKTVDERVPAVAMNNDSLL